MTIQEVSKVAGKVQELRRKSWPPGRTMRQGDNIIFEYVDFNADDWEVVEVEVIEAGDTVVEIRTGHIAHVLAIRDDLVCVEYRPCGGYFTEKTFYKQRRLCDITLISKGPKVHTFEGVKWSIATLKDAQELKRSSPFVGCGNLEPFAQFEGGNKRYTMTLTEEVVPELDGRN